MPPKNFDLQIHLFGKKERPTSYAVELRPHSDTWNNFFVAIPLRQRDFVQPRRVRLGRVADAPDPNVAANIGDDGYLSADGAWWLTTLRTGEVTPLSSAYYYCRRLPAALVFGSFGGVQQNVLLTVDASKPPPTLP